MKTGAKEKGRHGYPRLAAEGTQLGAVWSKGKVGMGTPGWQLSSSSTRKNEESLQEAGRQETQGKQYSKQEVKKPWI